MRNISWVAAFALSSSLSACSGLIGSERSPGAGSEGGAGGGGAADVVGTVPSGTGGDTGAGSTSGASGGATGTTDTGGTTGAAGASAAGGASGTSACSSDGIPGDVAAMLQLRCIACHGSTPLPGVPASFTSYASLTAPSKTDPTKSNAALAVARMQNDAMPMPPAPLMRATAAEIATLSAWVAAGTPKADCSSADAGVATDAAPVFDPFAAAATCTSMKMWTRGESAQMNPGQACITCHSRGEGPKFALAGTLYPTGHEPDNCDGVAGMGTTGAQIVIVGADGNMITLTPNSAGNFSYQGALALPYLAKVVYMGRERAMIESQSSGDCNSCHTQNGAMPSGTMKAPGRIVLP